MNIANYAISNKVVIRFFILLSFFGGIVAFQKLGKQEDAPFIIKEAVITTPFPGASPQEVEELVTEVVEREIQTHWGVDFIRSESWEGMSIVKVSMLETIPKEQFNQIWDELRRKVLDVTPKLPTGAGPAVVNDDFGDVFGVYFGISAEEGFSYKELEKYSEFLKRELITVRDVKKVSLYGIQPKVVKVEYKQERLVNAGVNPMDIINTLQSQNKLVKSGALQTGENEIRVETEGTFQSIKEIGELIITGQENNQLRLKDLVDISEGYQDPSKTMFRLNGKKAVGLGISTRIGGNSVEMGKSVDEKMKQLMKQLPVGIEVEELYRQDKVAVEANSEFIVNLIISVSIVVLLILLAMGVRAGVLIGASLLLTILATFLMMLLFGIDLHRTSLAAIIVAMGMLVDNAIVVADNAMINMQKGMSKRDALIKGASVPQWGLLGATFIAVISFLPLYMAPSNTAEVVKPLFLVLAISLTLSWIFAMAETPVDGESLLKEPENADASKDPYDTPFYKKLQRFIEMCVNNRWKTVLMVIGLFILSFGGFQYVGKSFFPAIEKNMYKVDYFTPYGSSMEYTEGRVKEVEAWLKEQEGVEKVSISLGSSHLRFYLATTSYTVRPNFANFLIETKDTETANRLMKEMETWVDNHQSGVTHIYHKFKVSPFPEGIVEVTIDGPEIDVLRSVGEEVKNVMRAEPLATDIRDGWGGKVLTWNPVYSQYRGQSAGVTREMMANSLKRLTVGQPMGEYREGDDVMPILIMDERRKNYNFDNIGSLQIFSNKGGTVGLDQIIEGYDLKWDDIVIRRYNRQRSLAIQCDPIAGVENVELENALMPFIDEIEARLPEGYRIWWDGVYFKQQSSQVAIASQLPIAVLLIITVLIVLFNSVKKTIAILLNVPLIIIGVVFAFLITGGNFDFFAIIGLLGLIGMVIKNAIVLIEQADIEIEENGLDQYSAIVTAARNRAIPVGMAAGTTILGMAPLIPDPMFGGMASAIMGGLFAATILTIFVLPVFYVILFNAKAPSKEVETVGNTD